MKRLNPFLLASILSLSAFADVSASPQEGDPIQLTALLDTNNPASIVALLTLSRSNLDFTINPPFPFCTHRVDIISTASGETIWTISAGARLSGLIITWPPPTNGFPGNGEDPPPPPGSGHPCTSRFGKLPASFTNSAVLSDAQIVTLLHGFSAMIFFENNRPVAIAQIVLRDSDGDGVVDSQDFCPETVSGSVVNSHGCSIDQLVPCEADWKNHGEFVGTFNRIAAGFQAAGLISASQARQLMRACAQSDCGK